MRAGGHGAGKQDPRKVPQGTKLPHTHAAAGATEKPKDGHKVSRRHSMLDAFLYCLSPLDSVWELPKLLDKFLSDEAHKNVCPESV